MNDKASARRLVENEAVFRQYNEKVQLSLEKLDELAISEGYIAPDTSKLTLQFYCECSDENCMLRIPFHVNQYAKIHKNRRHFVVVPSHEVILIEKVITMTPNYFVVKKFTNAPEQPQKLNSTETNNVLSSNT